jgi:hypothetical protein
VRAEVEGGLVRVGRDDVPHEAQPVGEHGTELVRDPIMGHVPDMGADKSFIKKAAKPRAIFFRKLRTAFKRLPDGCWTLPAGFAQGVVDGLVDDNAGGNPWQHLLLALATILPRLVEHRPFEERTGQELLPLLRRSLYPSRDPDAGIVLVGENEPLADFRDLASELAERANAPAAFSGIVADRLACCNLLQIPPPENLLEFESNLAILKATPFSGLLSGDELEGERHEPNLEIPGFQGLPANLVRRGDGAEQRSVSGRIALHAVEVGDARELTYPLDLVLVLVLPFPFRLQGRNVPSAGRTAEHEVALRDADVGVVRYLSAHGVDSDAVRPFAAGHGRVCLLAHFRLPSSKWLIWKQVNPGSFRFALSTNICSQYIKSPRKQRLRALLPLLQSADDKRANQVAPKQTSGQSKWSSNGNETFHALGRHRRRMPLRQEQGPADHPPYRPRLHRADPFRADGGFRGVHCRARRRRPRVAPAPAQGQVLACHACTGRSRPRRTRSSSKTSTCPRRCGSISRCKCTPGRRARDPA